MPFDVLNPRWAEMTPLAGPTATSGVEGNVLVLETASGPLSVSLHAQGARVRMGAGRAYDYAMLAGEPEPLALQVEPQDDAVVVRSGRLALRIGRDPLTLTLESDGRRVLGPPTDGHFVRERRAGSSPSTSPAASGSMASVRSGAGSTSAANWCAPSTRTRSA